MDATTDTADTAAPFVVVAHIDEVSPGTVLPVTVADRVLALVNAGDRVYALAGDCPHAAGPLGEGSLAADGCQLRCPWHGASFDVRTGAALHGPARKPVRTYPVTVDYEGWIGVAVGPPPPRTE